MTCVKKSKLIFRGAHRLTGTGIVESLEIVDVFGQARATVMRATRNGVSLTTNYVTVEKSRNVTHRQLLSIDQV